MPSPRCLPLSLAPLSTSSFELPTEVCELRAPVRSSRLIFAGRGDEAINAEWLDAPAAGPTAAAGAGFRREGNGGAASLLSVATLIFAVAAAGCAGLPTGILDVGDTPSFKFFLAGLCSGNAACGETRVLLAGLFRDADPRGGDGASV